MKKFKNIFIASSLSVSLFTIVSTILYSIFGRGSFQFVTPFNMQLSDPIFNAWISLILYITFGISIYYGLYIMKHGKFGFNITTFSHFVMSWFVISILGIATNYSMDIPNKTISDYYFGDSTYIYFLIYSIILTFIIYILVYIFFIIYYKFQVREINKTIKD